MIIQFCKYTKTHWIVHFIKMILINELYQENFFFKIKYKKEMNRLKDTKYKELCSPRNSLVV